jgi:hypothetical protein
MEMPELKNLIVVNTSAKWIDFIDVIFHPFYVKQDWQTLIRTDSPEKSAITTSKDPNSNRGLLEEK